jgi:pimeloyl-ACP methyl ester carboxylesterase
LAALVAGGLLPVVPLGHWAYQGFSSIMPAADRRVFADSEIEAMFLDDIAFTARGRFQVDDLRLFGRNWGFRLADVKAPVRWWQGDADPIVSVEEVKSAVSYLPDVELILRPGKSHLGGFADVEEILGFIRPFLPAEQPAYSIR